VCNAGVRVEDLGQVKVLLIDQLLQRGDLADLLDGKDLVLLVAINGEPGGVVTAVLEALEACGGMLLATAASERRPRHNLPLTNVSRMYFRSFSTR